MVMESLGADSRVKPLQVNGLEEPIKFGLVDNTQATNELAKDGLGNSTAIFPKDAVDEWPEPKQIHNFYVVKFRSYEDPKMKVKLDQADKEIQKRNQSRFQLLEALKEKRSEKSSIISELKPLEDEDRGYRAIIVGKIEEIKPFHSALGSLRTAESVRKSEGICSSEQELDNLIRSLHFHLQHESNTISEEKQLLKDIKYLEGTREKVIANAAMKAKIGDSFGRREDMQGQIKQIGVDLEKVKKDQLAVRAQIKKLRDRIEVIDKAIKSLQEELVDLDSKRGKAYDNLHEIRKEREEGNACFYQNRALLNNVKTLAAKKDIAALQELCHVEVEKFMSQWNGSKAFREDYVRRVLPSLDGRQMSKDGRMRNPDEKPIMPEVSMRSFPEPQPPKASVAKSKEEVSKPPQPVKVPLPKEQKEETKKKVETKKPDELELKFKPDVHDEEESLDFGKPPKDSVVDETDAAKLKELKREEEIAKARMAQERKKKLAEKAEAKAAARAQKEAEKKLKEKEKKARKKAAVSAPSPTDDSETETKTEELEEPVGNNETTLPAKSNKEQRDNIRYRKNRKSAIQLPKPVPKRKKQTSYWVWAIPAAVLSVMMAMALGYYYYYGKKVMN